MTDSTSDICARCGVTIVEHESGIDGTPVYIAADGSYCCSEWHGHDEHGVYAPNHTLDPDEDTLAVLDYTDDCRPNEDGWSGPPAFVTSCCGSPSILQDAYVNPNAYPAEVVSTFDNFICDNEECDNYGAECSCISPEKWKNKA